MSLGVLQICLREPECTLAISQMSALTTGQDTRLPWSNSFSLLLKIDSLCRKLCKIYGIRHKESKSEIKFCSPLSENLNKVHKL